MIQSNFMEKLLDGVEVEWKTIEEIIIDKFWIMPATPKFNEDAEIPYITSKNIKGGHISFEKVKFISRPDYIELSRNTPLLIQLFFLYFGLPKIGIILSSEQCAIIGVAFL